MATQVITEAPSLGHNPGIASDDQLSDVSVPVGRVLGSDLPLATPEMEVATPKLATSRAWIVIAQLCGINFVSSFSNGLVTVGLPTIASALSIPDNLLLWPVSVYFLTGGSCLLIAGSIADAIGPRKVHLVGCLLAAAFILASGLARHSIDLILFRAFHGIASAMVLPTAVSIISTNVKDGRPRNIGFAMIFLAQPLGFALGLVLGGVFVSGRGWRVGFYMAAAIGFSSFAVGIWTLPPDPALGSTHETLNKLAKDIDWVGAVIAGGSLAMFSYVLAMLSANTSNIKDAGNIVMLVVSLALLGFFVFWMWWQEKHGNRPLIPNSIWKNTSFTTICVIMLLSNAVNNSLELFSSLFFQEVQELSAVDASIRILPQVVVGVILEFLSGIFVNKVAVTIPVQLSSVLCAASPLLLATINPAWPYWYSAFWAQVLAPVSVDILYTVGTLVVSSAFPTKTQALAGAVFSTFAQLGASIGICAMSVISASVTAESKFEDKSSPEALMEGYRVSFWTLFGWMLAAAVIGGVGLRNLGKIGLKRD